MDGEQIHPVGSSGKCKLGGSGEKFRTKGKGAYKSIGSSGLILKYDGHLIRLVPNGCNRIIIQVVYQIGYSLSLHLQRRRKNNLDLIGIDLVPAHGGRI